MSVMKHLSKFPEMITNEKWSVEERQDEQLYRISLEKGNRKAV